MSFAIMKTNLAVARAMSEKLEPEWDPNPINGRSTQTLIMAHACKPHWDLCTAILRRNPTLAATSPLFNSLIALAPSQLVCLVSWNS